MLLWLAGFGYSTCQTHAEFTVQKYSHCTEERLRSAGGSCRAAANTDLKDAVSREGFKSLLDVTNSSLSRAGRERIPGRDSDAPVTFHCLRNEGREKKIDGAAVERNLRTKSRELLNVGGWNSLPKYPSELLMNWTTKGSAYWYEKERLHTDKSPEGLLTGRGVSWGQVTEGMGGDEPPLQWQWAQHQQTRMKQTKEIRHFQRRGIFMCRLAHLLCLFQGYG